MAHDAHPDNAPKSTNLAHLALFLFGGVCTGFGILNLYWAFGRPVTPGSAERVGLNENFHLIGFNAHDDIATLPAIDYAIPLLVVGVLALVYANATAWKQTNGY
jgi:hypothetical protein